MPNVAAAVTGADVAVAIRLKDGDTIHCLFGTRLAGAVTTWHPSHKQVQPGESSCDPQTARYLQEQPPG
jgi:hypothetical protein